jgi:hypothetical protein
MGRSEAIKRLQTSAVGLAKRIGHLLRLGQKPILREWPLLADSVEKVLFGSRMKISTTAVRFAFGA